MQRLRRIRGSSFFQRSGSSNTTVAAETCDQHLRQQHDEAALKRVDADSLPKTTTTTTPTPATSAPTSATVQALATSTSASSAGDTVIPPIILTVLKKNPSLMMQLATHPVASKLLQDRSLLEQALSNLPFTEEQLVREPRLLLRELEQFGIDHNLIIQPKKQHQQKQQQHSSSTVDSFWQQQLSGIAAPTPVVKSMSSPYQQQQQQQQQHSPCAVDCKIGKGHHHQQPEEIELLSMLQISALKKPLKSFLSKYDTTFEILVQAVWTLLLSRWTGECDIVFGISLESNKFPASASTASVAAVHKAEEFDFFQPLRIKISDPEMHFGDWFVDQFQSKRKQLIEHAAPTSHIRSCCQIPDDAPFFETVCFADRHLHDEQKLMRLLRGEGGFPLMLRILERDGATASSTGRGLDFFRLLHHWRCVSRLSLLYDPRCFHQSTIARVVGHFNTLLDAIVNDPHRPLSGIPMLTTQELRTSLIDWNQTRRAQQPYFADSGLLAHQVFERRASEVELRDKVAVEFEGQTLTYSQLNARANQLAQALAGEYGVRSRSLVAVFVEQSLKSIVAQMGVLKAGCAYVPIDVNSTPLERVDAVLKDAMGPSFVVISEERFTSFFEQLAELDAARYSGMRVLYIDRDWDQVVAKQPESSLPASVLGLNPDDLVYVIFTSGSTGRPKGVQISHRNVLNVVNSVQRFPGLSQDDVMLGATTFSFDVGQLDFFLPLLTGAKLYMFRPHLNSCGEKVQKAIAESNASVMGATPSTWHILVDSGWEGSQRLRVWSGGEALSIELATKLLPKCGALFNMYGPTETTIWSSAVQIEKLSSINNCVPVGRPLDNTQFYLIDPVYKQPVPIGAIGELYIGGEGVARGYLNRPDLNAEKFLNLDAVLRTSAFSSKGISLLNRRRPRTNRSSSSSSTISAMESVLLEAVESFGGRAFRTGDLFRLLPDGTLQFVGRNDSQVKIRGFRIELGDIEACLRKHEEIDEAVAVVREFGPDDKRIIAFVTLRTQKANDQQSQPQPQQQQRLSKTLRKFVEQLLPKYMIPSAFVFVDQFPRTANEKIDRKPLLTYPLDFGSKSKYAEAAKQSSNFVEPRDPIEQQVAGIFESILGVAAVSATDDFFELGGHSMMSIQMMALIVKTFNVEVPFTALLHSSTVEKMASIIKELLGHTTTCKDDDEEEEVEGHGDSGSVGINSNPNANVDDKAIEAACGTTHHADPRSLVVTFQSGNPQRTPFFCVHPAFNSCMVYASMSSSVGEDQPFYGLEPRHKGENKYVSIEQMAADYVEAMRSVQPKGPYIVGGWSFGSVVAFEIAQQLKDRYGEDATVMLVDGRAPLYTPEDLAKDVDAIQLVLIFSNLKYGNGGDTGNSNNPLAGMDLSIDYTDLARVDPDARLLHIATSCRLLEKMSGQLLDKLPLDVAFGIFDRMRRDFTYNEMLCRKYYPKKFDGKMVLLHAEEKFVITGLDDSLDNDPTLGWDRLCSHPDGVEVVQVPKCNHNNMVFKPYVHELARVLRECFDKLQPAPAPAPPVVVQPAHQMRRVSDDGSNMVGNDGGRCGGCGGDDDQTLLISS